MLNSSGKNRGVADTIGYILILGIIFASISAVYFVGFDVLNTTRDIEEDQNIERSLSIFMTNENEVIQGQAPSRSTEVRLGDNEVRTIPETSRMYVYLPNKDISYINEASSLAYSSPTGTYYYELGGLIRTSQDEKVMRVVNEPDLLKYIPSSNTLHIQMLAVSTDEESVSGGIREIALNKTQNSISRHEFSSTRQIEIYIRTPRTLIWTEYYENQPAIDNCEPYAANEIVCYTQPIDNLTIQQTSLRINIF